MNVLARMALRPALLAGLAGAEVAAAACVSAASKRSQPAFVVARHMSSKPSEEALRKAERMVEMMGESPQLQQMILNTMPAPFRSPEMVKQMFKDPATRRKIAEMMASRGFSIPDHLLDRMTPGNMDTTFDRAKRLGLDPAQMFSKLMAHPGLLSQLQQPRVMAAFLDMAEDPTRQAKYENDKELLEVVFKAREVLGSARSPIPVHSTVGPAAAETTSTATASAPVSEPEAPAAASSSAATAPGTVQPPPPGQPPHAESVSAQPPPPGQPPRAESASVQPPPPGQPPSTESVASEPAASEAASASGEGISMNPLISLMRSDPKAARWLDNPRVMKALEEINNSPWKTVKYIMDRDVMEAFKDLSNLIRGKKV